MSAKSMQKRMIYRAENILYNLLNTACILQRKIKSILIKKLDQDNLRKQKVAVKYTEHVL